jgi:hypothetical protein
MQKFATCHACSIDPWIRWCPSAPPPVGFRRGTGGQNYVQPCKKCRLLHFKKGEMEYKLLCFICVSYTRLYLVTMLKVSGAVPPFTHTPSWRAQGLHPLLVFSLPPLFPCLSLHSINPVFRPCFQFELFTESFSVNHDFSRKV